MTSLGTLVLALAMSLTGAPVEATDAEMAAFRGFDEIANHYKCYRVKPIDDQAFPTVELSDQFKESKAKVIRPRYLCNPTKKITPDHQTTIIDFDLHYVCFEIIQDPSSEPFLPLVQTSNQFGRQRLQPVESELLCLPSKKVHI